MFFYIHRQSKRPSSTFTTVAGSSQVKWNRKNNFLFGSAHDGDIRIWDIRVSNFICCKCPKDVSHLEKVLYITWWRLNYFSWSPQVKKRR